MTDIFTQMYSAKVMQYFMRPKNFGEMKKPDGMAVVGNKRCGDIMKFYIRVKKVKNQEYIAQAKFQTLGCGAAIASSSVLTEMVQGKTLKEAIKIDRKKIVKFLGGLPPVKIHCSVLADEGLKKAIKDYRSHQKKK